MFDPAAFQVADVLMFVANLAPIALYFLALGLVNSHARPYLITSRSDFLLLTCVLMPVLCWPVPTLISTGGWWALLAAAVAFGVLFRRLLPGRHAGFVIYNISEAHCRRLLQDSLIRLGWTGHWDADAWRSERGDVSIHLSKLAPLRNVTIHVECAGRPQPERVERLAHEIQTRLAGVAQLPSAMGACLVLIGVLLLIMPMWMVGRHIDDLADALSHLFG